MVGTIWTFNFLIHQLFARALVSVPRTCRWWEIIGVGRPLITGCWGLIDWPIGIGLERFHRGCRSVYRWFYESRRLQTPGGVPRWYGRLCLAFHPRSTNRVEWTSLAREHCTRFLYLHSSRSQSALPFPFFLLPIFRSSFLSFYISFIDFDFLIFIPSSFFSFLYFLYLYFFYFLFLLSFPSFLMCFIIFFHFPSFSLLTSFFRTFCRFFFYQ